MLNYVDCEKRGFCSRVSINQEREVSPMIRMIDVEMEYDNGTEAIRGLSLDIQDGEFAFLVLLLSLKQI